MVGDLKRKAALVLITFALLSAPVFGQTTAKEWFEKGNVSIHQANYNEAIRDFDKAIELNSSYATAWLGKGVALKLLDRITESEAALAKAKELGYMG